MTGLLRGKAGINLLGLFLSILFLSANYAGVEAKERKDTRNPTKAVSSLKRVGRGLIGKMAPDFILDSLTGEKYQLSSARGKVVLIDFWHTY